MSLGMKWTLMASFWQLREYLFLCTAILGMDFKESSLAMAKCQLHQNHPENFKK